MQQTIHHSEELDAGPVPQRTVAVLHLPDTTGPSESLLPDLAWLAEHGEVHTVVPETGRAGDAFAALGPVDVLPYQPLTVPGGPVQAARLLRDQAAEVRTFRRYLRQTRPELVIAVTATLPAVLIAARLARVPVLTYVGEIFDKRYLDGPVRHTLNRMAVALTTRTSKGVLCCSETVARQFDARRLDVTTLYPPIGDHYADGDGDALRARLGLANADPLLTVVGNLSPGRGQDLLINALPEIRRTLPDARALVVGSPHPRESDRAYARGLEERAHDLGLADAVVFAGFVERMADVYAAADIVVNPARFNEPFGRVACEALVAGRPVIATHVGAIPEVLRAGTDALIVAPDDPSALAGATLRLAGDKSLRHALVQAGRERVMTTFNETTNVETFARAVRRAMAR